MAGWSLHKGSAVHLPLENVDTDQLIPARFMSVPRCDGYGPYLMHDLRRGSDGALLADFPLNGSDASILISGRNFGSGSSREAAVYALVDAGYLAVIAPSFGDIFASNAVNNGLLPAVLPQAQIDGIVRALDEGGQMVIDLAAGNVSVGAVMHPLQLDLTWREKLINGWDDIDLSMKEADRIAAFRADRVALGWVWPRL
ncbi:MAG: 3-isopropylmalate dehydratase small subunit [Sulfitobacter sp.]